MIQGVSGPLGVGITISLRDRFSARSRAVERRFQQLGYNANRVIKSNLTAIRNASAVMAGIGALAIRGMAGWIREGAEFGFVMKSVEAVTSALPDQIRALRSQAKQLGRETIFTINEVAGAMKFMGMAGLGPNQIQGAMDAVVALGAATQKQIGGKGGAADIMTNLMTAFDLLPSQAMQAADILTKAVTSANIGMTDLGDAMRYVSGTSHQLNIGLDETAAMIGILGNRGLQGTMAGTALENTLRFLSKATSELFRTGRQNKALGLLGVTRSDLVDQNQELRSMVDIVSMLSEKTRGMSNLQVRNLLGAIVGVRGARGLLPLLQKTRTGKNFADLLKDIRENSPGEALRISGEMMETLKGKIMIAGAAWEEFKATFAESLAPIVKPLLIILAKVLSFISKIMSNPLGKWLTIIGVLLVVVGTAAAAAVAIMATVSLLLTQNMVNFQTLALTSELAYARMGKAAMGFAATQTAANVATRMNAAGSLIYAAGPMKGRIIKTAASMGGAAATGAAATGMGMWNMIKGPLMRVGMWVARAGAALLSFLGGPWGIAIGLGITALIAALSWNTDATTEASKVSAAASEVARNRYYTGEVDKFGTPLTMDVNRYGRLSSNDKKAMSRTQMMRELGSSSSFYGGQMERNLSREGLSRIEPKVEVNVLIKNLADESVLEEKIKKISDQHVIDLNDLQ